jgi:hypothetical protein
VLGNGGAAIFTGIMAFNAAPASPSHPASGKRKRYECNVNDLFNYSMTSKNAMTVSKSLSALNAIPQLKNIISSMVLNT